MELIYIKLWIVIIEEFNLSGQVYFTSDFLHVYFLCAFMYILITKTHHFIHLQKFLFIKSFPFEN